MVLEIGGLKNRPVSRPDPFSPGNTITVMDPLSVISSCSRVFCPVCDHLIAELSKPASPDSTEPGNPAVAFFDLVDTDIAS
jgi:hypothetical protein